MNRFILAFCLSFLLPVSLLAKVVQYNLRIDGIVCSFCVATSAKALKKIKGVKKITWDLEKGIIKVCADDKVDMSDKRLTKLFKEKGFTYRSKTIKEKCE